MALSLSIVDNADATGATATVAGSDTGQTVTVWVQSDRFATFGASGVWVSAGSRTGNGNATLSVAPAYLWAYAAGVVSGAAAITGPVRFLATRGDESVFEKILNAVFASVQELSLETLGNQPVSLTADDIHQIEGIPTAETLLPFKLPGVFVYPTPIAETQPGQTTAQDDIGYAVSVTLIDRRSPSEASAIYDTYRKWRQQLRRAFLSRRLAGVVEQFLCTWEPRPPNAWVTPEYDRHVSDQVFRFTTREGRYS